MAENEKRKVPAKKQRRRMTPAKAVGCILLAAVLVFLYIRFAPSRERMEPKDYFEKQLSKDAEDSVVLKDGEAAVVLQDTIARQTARISDGEVYLPYDSVRANLNSRFYWDEEGGQMLYTTADSIWTIPVNSKTYKAGEKEESAEREILIQDEGGLYMDAGFLAEYTNMEYSVGEDGCHIFIRYKWGEQTTATVRSDAPVRWSGGIKAVIVATAKQGSTVQILEQMENWSRVVTDDGFIGYMQNKRLKDIKTTEVTRDFEEQEYPALTKEDQVSLIWHVINNSDSNGYLTSDTENMTGINVISPTWFELADNSGTIKSYADKKYVSTAHKADMEVWGLISNFSSEISTTTILSSTAARRNVIDQLMAEAKKVGLDGINVDLEAITEDGAYGYVQFIRELSIECRAAGLILSVDVPVPMAYNGYYDRKEIGTVADYVIMMGYDEHYVGSDAGSVASLSFEENGIKDTLKEGVPAAKLISAVPFYTRLWFTQTNSDGSESVWSEAHDMSTIANTIKNYGVETTWDEDAGQDYADWTLDDGIRCQIWVENAKSLALKTELVKEHELGGIAAWRLGFESSDAWAAIALTEDTEAAAETTQEAVTEAVTESAEK